MGSEEKEQRSIEISRSASKLHDGNRSKDKQFSTETNRLEGLKIIITVI